jgi:hypothetical protein
MTRENGANAPRQRTKRWISEELSRAECKLIAGVAHVRVPCSACGDLIWTSLRAAQDWQQTCSACVDTPCLSARGRPGRPLGESPAAGDNRYHGPGRSDDV